MEENVKIGPYAVIGKNAKIGAGTVIDSFAQVLGYTQVGENCRIFSYAVVGNIPQDLKYKGEESYLIIGDDNLIREFVTINPGTNKGAKTIIGSGNLIMAYSHIAHDCRLGDGNVLANGATLAGYVDIGDKVVIGGLTAVHQFCRIGSYAIVGGCSKVVQDVLPYSISDGHPAKLRGLNIIGLKRAGFGRQTISALHKIIKVVMAEKHSWETVRKKINEEFPSLKEAENLLDFIRSTQRGIGR